MPEHPVIVTTHVHLLSPEYWDRALKIKRSSAGWQALLTEAGVNLVIVEGETHPLLRQALLKEPGWQVVLDEVASGVKRDPRNRFFIAIRQKPL
jgi:hypothetical protein